MSLKFPVSLVGKRASSGGDVPFATSLYDSGENLLVSIETDIPDNWNDFNTPYNATRLEIGTSCTSIGNYAFVGCFGLTGDLVIPNTVTDIGAQAFTDIGCDGLLTIGTGVSTLGTYVFRSSKFTTISIPNNVTFVGYGCFRECTNLTTVYIDTPVSSWSGGGFQGQAFRDCSALTSIYVSATYIAGYDEAWKTANQTTATISTWTNYPTIP